MLCNVCVLLVKDINLTYILYKIYAFCWFGGVPSDLLLLEAFRFEDENNYHNEIWFKVFLWIVKIQTLQNAL